MMYARCPIILCAIFLLVFLSFASCGVPGSLPAAKDDQGVEAIFKKAERDYGNHNYESALEFYFSIAENHPSSIYADRALYKVAGIYMKKGNWSSAILIFNRLMSQYSKSPYAVEGLYNQAFCYQKQNQYEKAVDNLSRYIQNPLARKKSQAFIYRANSNIELKKPQNALADFAAASADSDSETKKSVLESIKEILDSSPSILEFESVVKNLVKSEGGDYIRYRIAQAEIYSNRVQEAKDLLESINYSGPLLRFHKDAQNLLDSIREKENKSKKDITSIKVTGSLPLVQESKIGESPPVRNIPKPRAQPIKVGVVLPISGRASYFGRQVLSGMQTAVNVLKENDKSSWADVTLVVEDSQGESDVAGKAVAKLTADPDIKVILGPILSKTAIAAAEAAEQARVPIITMTNKDEICQGYNYVFRNFITSSHQAKALYLYATKYRNVFRFAILYPNNAYGKSMADSFASLLKDEENTLVAMVSYPENATDFKSQIAQLKGAGDFEALFIPDSADTVALLAPQLVFYNVSKVILLLPSSCNNDELARKASKYITDSVIVDGFFARSADPVISRFATEYRSQTGQDPTLLSAIGYDSVNLVEDVVRRGGGADRDIFCRVLRATRNFDGVTGETDFLESGDVHKKLFLLRVGQDAIEELY